MDFKLPARATRGARHKSLGFGGSGDSATGAERGAVQSGHGVGKIQGFPQGHALQNGIAEGPVEDVAGAGGVDAIDHEGGRVRKLAALESEGAVDGYIYSTPAAFPNGVSLAAGDISNNLYYQSYISFNMMALPGVTTATEAMVTIVSATAQVTQTSTAGDPFGKLGAMLFEQIVYGPTLEVADATAPALLSFPTTSTATVKSVTVTTAVRDDWTMRSTRSYRSQYRIRFTQNTNADSITDYVVFAAGENATAASRPQLAITYNYP